MHSHTHTTIHKTHRRTPHQLRHAYATTSVRARCAIVFIVLLIVLSIFGQLSFHNILLQSAVLAIMALGQTFVIISGGIDLSVGSVGALAGAFAAGFIVRNSIAPPIAMLLAVLIGVGIGIINGVFIHAFTIPPFVATLSMLTIARGFTLLYTNGTPIYSDHPLFTALSSGGILGISPAILLVAVLYAIGFVVLKYTPYGLHVYAIGNNKKTARLSGVKVAQVTIASYAICSACASLGGIVLASRLWSAQPNAALGFELDVIAVVVLGGASLFGGVGTAQSTLIGVLVLGVLTNVMNLVRIPAYGQRVVWGAILIIIVGIDIYIRNKKNAQQVL